MAKITEYREIPLDDLTIGKGQVRKQDPGKDVGRLAESIKRQGLLQPIIVCKSRDGRKWEILAGQRRFLAHRYLNRSAITAAVLDSRVGEEEAKAISITENLMRRKLSGRDLKEGVLYLYKYYGSIRDVHEATGLPYSTVRDNVKYPRLIPELKELVDEHRVDINAAVKAQDAATYSDLEQADPGNAVKLALEMNAMSGVQRKSLTKELKSHPEKPVDEVIEDAKTSGKVTQIVVTVTRDTRTALQAYANQEKTTQDEAAASLIEESLAAHGLLGG